MVADPSKPPVTQLFKLFNRRVKLVRSVSLSLSLSLVRSKLVSTVRSRSWRAGVVGHREMLMALLQARLSTASARAVQLPFSSTAGAREEDLTLDRC